MNKFLATTSARIGTIVIASQLFITRVYAVNEKIDPCENLRKGTFNSICSLSANNLSKFLGSVISMIFVVAIIVALFYLIYGGIKWLMSEGDKSSVEAARQHIIAAIIGLIIVFLSYFILNFVLAFFTGGKGIFDITLPTITT